MKLDVNGDASVRLDDIARNYDVRGSRDTTRGLRTQEQHYRTFMGLWGHNVADARVSFEDFVAYYENISVAYATDAEFSEMMTACWAL